MRSLIRNVKHWRGWRSRRKRVAIAVDDYGNVRLDSKEARERLDAAGVKARNRFDMFDTLETREDLESLYEVLDSVRDGRGKPAVFTPYALPCNIDFEQIDEDVRAGHSAGHSAGGNGEYNGKCSGGYKYEKLPRTYEKLTARMPRAYEGTWSLWQEGVRRGLMHPQFHGREHLNLKLFEEKLRRRDPDMMANIANRSYAGIRQTAYRHLGWTAAFSFESADEIDRFPEILTTGLDAFEEVFGYRATAFTPPAQQFHPSLRDVLLHNGVQAIDRPWQTRQHLGDGKYRRTISWMEMNRKTGMVTMVRNGVFEPTSDLKTDWVGNALSQIETAFRWNRPAIISSHRVNFCGHINPKQRKTGLTALKRLLEAVTRRWLDVEFVSVAELVDAIQRGDEGAE